MKKVFTKWSRKFHEEQPLSSPFDKMVCRSIFWDNKRRKLFWAIYFTFCKKYLQASYQFWFPWRTNNFKIQQRSTFKRELAIFLILMSSGTQTSTLKVRLSNSYPSIFSEVWMPLMVTIQPWSLAQIHNKSRSIHQFP